MLKFKSLVLLAFLASVSVFSHAEDYLKSIKEFELKDQNGNMHSLDDYADKDYIVVYTHGSGCPIARLSVPEYVKLEQEYSEQNIEFLMLNSFIQDDIPRIKNEAEEFNITFPILKDADQSVGRSLGAERTAEAFIIDPRTQEVLFRGPINDGLGYETQRTVVENHYLKNALDTIIAGDSVNMSNIPDAKGCLIGYFLS